MVQEDRRRPRTCATFELSAESGRRSPLVYTVQTPRRLLGIVEQSPRHAYATRMRCHFTRTREWVNLILILDGAVLVDQFCIGVACVVRSAALIIRAPAAALSQSRTRLMSVHFTRAAGNLACRSMQLIRARSRD